MADSDFELRTPAPGPIFAPQSTQPAPQYYAPSAPSAPPQSTQSAIRARLSSLLTTRNLIILVVVVVIIFLLYRQSSATGATPGAAPVSPSASAEADALLAKLEKTGAIV